MEQHIFPHVGQPFINYNKLNQSNCYQRGHLLLQIQIYFLLWHKQQTQLKDSFSIKNLLKLIRNKFLLQVDNHFYQDVFAISGFIFFVGPMTAICVLYVLIGVKLKRSRLLQAVQRRCYDVNRGISAQTRVIRMLGKYLMLSFLVPRITHTQGELLVLKTPTYKIIFISIISKNAFFDVILEILVFV